MHIVSLFCEIDDFFLSLEKYIAEHCLPTSEKPERRCRPRRLQRTQTDEDSPHHKCQFSGF